MSPHLSSLKSPPPTREHFRRSASPSARSTQRAACTRFTAHAATRTSTLATSRVVGVAPPATSVAKRMLASAQILSLWLTSRACRRAQSMQIAFDHEDVIEQTTLFDKDCMMVRCATA